MPFAMMTTTAVFLALAVVWKRGWTGRFGVGWRWKLSVVFCGNGRSTQRGTFGHRRVLQASKKPNVRTRNATNDAVAVALWKMRKLSKPYPRENIQERNSPSRVFGAERLFHHPVAKDKAKEAKRFKYIHTFRNIKSSELSATHSPIPPLAVNRVDHAKSTGSSPIVNRRRSG